MKTKEKHALFGAKPEELQKNLNELRIKLAAISRDRYTKQSKNSREAKTLRTQIAVVKTILRQKELTHG